MQLKINGKFEDFPAGLTLIQLLDHYQINPQRVAVQLNLEIVKREAYPQTVLKTDDHLEIISFMGGG
jgi:sulfur carrier protein